VVMTRHKVSNQRRRCQADRRDYRRLETCTPEFLDARSRQAPSPSRMIAGRELLEEFRRRLTDEERQVADLRGQGCDWAEIAQELGGTPEARRKQLARAIDRIERDVEEAEGGHG